MMLCSCQNVDKNLYSESGVSIELAKERKRAIKDLTYDLRFKIPEDKMTEIEGVVNISFQLEFAEQIIVDFRESADKIKKVEVNGDLADYIFTNEHIVIPKEYFNKGRNDILVEFISGNQSVNRNDEFLYTLLVPDRARTLFPCFDQPNMKANFKLHLTVPCHWEAVSNSAVEKETIKENVKQIDFYATEPLSTYLFSFVAGKLYKCSYSDAKHSFTAYHRETDSKKIAQLDTIFKQIAHSIDWLEEYTGIKYPFSKYDFVILPGFQYGGMEHTGATLYNDTRMFLSDNPTLDEELKRSLLIAHETAHMWFGDLVTMDWFDDVWTKEVFANYFAALITEPLFPQINHRLNWLKNITMPALTEDRTLGTTSIKQPLDNLQNAGLVYGNIIYCKAPVMLEKLVELMGQDAFQQGIREYLKKYAYSNATWEDLIEILDSKTDKDLKLFSNTWVNEKGMPTITCNIQKDSLEIIQSDPYDRNLMWTQNFNVMLVSDSQIRHLEVNVVDRITIIPIPKETKIVLLNSDGRGYGYFELDKSKIEWLSENLFNLSDETTRQSMLMLLHENYCNGKILPNQWIQILMRGLSLELNPLIISSICSYIQEPLITLKNQDVEKELFQTAISCQNRSSKLQLMRILFSNTLSKEVTERIYSIWDNATDNLYGETDYMTMAWELALRYPEKSKQIINKQRNRISNQDRLKQFDFICQAITADTISQDKFFKMLLKAENRAIEPYAETALAYLNHPLRQPYSEKYIYMGLETLQEVQRTGDIFFPRNWCVALLSKYRSEKAKITIEKFLSDNPDYPVMLRNKIYQAAAPLYRAIDNQ